ncbi:MAG: acetolactate decarboxylase [Actinomycetota bacterium]|nr:acetolactate decarboxylase [Actinomycetota bacterium]MDP2289483.1 acetolactate decarboxylase [Actinomycetota bacterium]
MSARQHRRVLAVLVAALTSVLAAALLSSPSQAYVATWVDQVGTYDSLISPNYTGIVPVQSFINGQTLGIGTFDHLDGELVMVGGIAYRVGTDGTPRPVTDSATTPFFEAITFAPDWSGPVAPGTTCNNILGAVNTLAQTDKGVIAVRVRGTFTDLVTRSVPAQTTPYLPLADVVAKQTVFPLGARRAVLVGFRTGPDFAGIGAPGLHLHGLTADRTAGGHVLSCVAGNDVQLSVQRAAGFRVS